MAPAAPLAGSGSLPAMLLADLTLRLFPVVACVSNPSRGHAAMRYDWTDDKIEALSRMWLKEGLSASQIGAKLGTSRNSVIGKIHRLGLGLRPAHVRQRKTEALFGSYITIKPPRHFPEVYAPNGSRCALEDLEAFDRRCRYPHGDKAPYAFCGGVSVPGSSYCLAHLQACYTQPPKAAAASVENQVGDVFTDASKNPAEVSA